MHEERIYYLVYEFFLMEEEYEEILHEDKDERV